MKMQQWIFTIIALAFTANAYAVEMNMPQSGAQTQCILQAKAQSDTGSSNGSGGVDGANVGRGL